MESGAGMYRILITDDESVEREGIIYLINKFNLPLEIAQAANGKAALEYMQTNPIDILLTDVKMPLMDGLELAQHTFALYPDIRILIFSAYGEFEFAKKAMAAHAVSYLLKPIEVDEFQRVMNQILVQCDALAATRASARLRDEEDRQLLFFRLVTGSGQVRMQTVENLFPGENLCLVHVLTENDYFAANEERFCKLWQDRVPLPFEYINTYPNESFMLLHSKDNARNDLRPAVTAVRDALRADGCTASFLLGQTFGAATEISERAQALTRIRGDLYEAPDAIVMEREISESVSYYAESVEKRRQEVRAALRNHQMDQVLPAAQRLLQQMEQNGTLSRMYLYHVLYELLFQIYEAYGVTEFDQINQGINRLLGCGSAAAMCDVLEDIMASLQGEERPHMADSSAIVRQVQRMIDAEYGQPLSLEYLAASVYITPSYLSYIFKQEMGQNLIKYITDYRMEKARAMMKDSTQKVSQIARDCGYDNPSYFNKLFKNYYGVTPRQYREGGQSEGSV